jgi:hypothetical protein
MKNKETIETVTISLSRYEQLINLEKATKEKKNFYINSYNHNVTLITESQTYDYFLLRMAELKNENERLWSENEKQVVKPHKRLFFNK